MIMDNNGGMELVNGGKSISMAIVDEKGNSEAMKVAAKMHNEAIDNYTKIIKEKTNTEIEEAKKVAEEAESFEIMPINNYVLVKPYAKNPFDKVEVTDSGIYIPSMGDNKSFKNPDSGEIDEEVNLSVQAKVIEVSPSCKFIKEGDVVYYRRVSGVPIPFFRQGLEVVAETSVQVIVNSGLTERFKEIKK